MRHSTDRILTTHVGSLPRSQAVTDVLFARERAEADAPASASVPAPAEGQAVIAAAVAEVVRRQVTLGIDVVSDGEMSKISYATYVARRLSGFAGDTPREPGQDLVEFPGLLRKLAERGSTAKYRRPRCVGPIAVKDTGPLEADLHNLRAAVREAAAAEAFMNAASPGVVALFQPNDFYRAQDDYLTALAGALQSEYEAIVAAGILLQIDAPDLAMGRHTMYRHHSLEEFERLAARHIEVLNHALRNVPAERVRMHVCWGNYEGPHHHDVPMERLLPIVLRARPQALLFEAANPRHAHEWAVFKAARIPEDKILIPGVLATTTNYIEHPQLVAERIERFAHIVGRERVIAGTDCGFGTFAGFGPVEPEIAYLKLASMVEGARIASARLWG
jgi:5-methyltetrahydropteroyltriglutamate--homocysteine methyltransferase